MAQPTIKTRITLDGGQEIEAQLKLLGKTGEEAFKKISAAVNKADFARLTSSIQTLGSDLATVGRRFALGFAGIAAVSTAATVAITSLVKASADAADEAGKAAQKTGLQVEAYGRLAYAAELADVSQEQFIAGMGRLNRALGEARAGNEKAVDLFKRLGVNIRDAQGRLRPTELIIRDISEAFRRMPDGALKSALAIELFGKAGAELLPFLNTGRDGLRELGEEAERLGIVFTKEQATIAESMNDTLTTLKRSAAGIRLQLGLIFAPTVTRAAKLLQEQIVANKDAILGFANEVARRAIPVIEDLLNTLFGNDEAVRDTRFVEWRDQIAEYGRSVGNAFNTVIIPAFNAYKQVLGTVADAINAVFGTDLSGNAVSIILLVGGLTGAFKALYSAVIVAYQAMRVLFLLAVRNPWVAAITAVAGGLLLWATRTDSATAAMEAHERLVDSVAAAYRKAGGEVAKMTQEVRDRLFVETAASLEKTRAAIEDTFDAAAGELFIARQNEVFGQLIQNFIDGNLAVGEFIDQISAIGRAQPELAGVAAEITNVVKPLEELTSKATFDTDFLDLLSGKLSDADFKAKHFGDTLANIEPPADVAAPVEQVGAAADAASQKVQELGRTITVTRHGEGEMTKEVFDVVDGIAKRAEQGKAAVDGLGQSATQAGQELQGVSNEITNSVRDAVPPDAAAQGVDQVISDVNRIAPAAQQAAGQANAALSDIGSGAGSGAEQAAQAIVQPFEGLQQRIAGIFAGIRTVAQTGFSSIAGLVRSLASQIEAEINRIIAALRRAAAEAARLRSQAARSSSSSSAGSGGSQGGFALGGHVRGPGTGTSDSILARLSNGEFVMRAAAVRKWGVGFLNALNGLRMPQGFSMGGLVDGLSRSLTVPMPRFAEGGLVGGGGRPFTLQLPNGETVSGMTIPESAVSQLRKFALVSARTSLGRKPRRS